MSTVTLKSLHHYLKLIENASELKRRLPASSNPRTLKEGLYEMSRLIGVDEAVFKDAQTIAALIGAQRFVMIWGEPSVTDQVARVFDSSRVLLTVLIGPRTPEISGRDDVRRRPSAGWRNGRTFPGWAQPKSEPPGSWAPLRCAEPEASLDGLDVPAFGQCAVDLPAFQGTLRAHAGFALPPAARREMFRWSTNLPAARNMAALSSPPLCSFWERKSTART